VNRRWRITSALVLIGLYLLTGAVTLHWWMAGFSLWGKHPAGGTFSWEPIITVLVVALPSAAICLVTRSRLVHAWLLIIGASQLLAGVNYVLHGAYFGCDRNGCSAEENFILGNVVAAICSVVGAIFIRLVVGAFAQQVRPRIAVTGDLVDAAERGSSADK
jgi:hypothetical protein